MLRVQLTNFLSFITNDDDGEVDIVRTFSVSKVEMLNFEINAPLINASLINAPLINASLINAPLINASL